MELNLPYRVQVNTDVAESTDEGGMLLAVRTLIDDQVRAGVRFASIRMIRVEHNGEFSPALTKKAWKLAREVLHAG